MKPSRYAERARCADRVCGGHWIAARLASGAAPPRTSDAYTGGAAHHDEMQLYLSEGTVRNYLSACIQKTGARNRAEALRIASERGWL
jgi:two-component system, NarL family, response regulator DesR